MQSRNKTILKLIRCPECLGRLCENKGSLICQKCNSKYSGINIPVLFRKKIDMTDKFSRRFYDQNPFDIYTPNVNNLEKLNHGKFPRKILKSIKPGQKIIDVGCGQSKYIKILSKNTTIWGIDQSIVSLKLLKKNCPTAILINASNLSIPLVSKSFDIVISTGVIHHTSDPQLAFSELVRILKPKGKLFLVVYNKGSKHHMMYASIGRLLQFIYKDIPLGEPFMEKFIIPIFYFLDTRLNNKTRNYRQSKALFFDSFLQPTASFHTTNEIEKWCKIENVKYRSFNEGSSDLIYSIITK